MVYEVVWDKKAYDSLSKLEPLVSRRIAKLVREFAKNPKGKDVKRLKGEEEFRLRAGDYRVIFSITGDRIIILKVGHRKNIY